jgi:hypothetical protein
VVRSLVLVVSLACAPHAEAPLAPIAVVANPPPAPSPPLSFLDDGPLDHAARLSAIGPVWRTPEDPVRVLLVPDRFEPMEVDVIADDGDKVRVRVEQFGVRYAVWVERGALEEVPAQPLDLRASPGGPPTGAVIASGARLAVTDTATGWRRVTWSTPWLVVSGWAPDAAFDEVYSRSGRASIRPTHRVRAEATVRSASGDEAGRLTPRATDWIEVEALRVLGGAVEVALVDGPARVRGLVDAAALEPLDQDTLYAFEAAAPPTWTGATRWLVVAPGTELALEPGLAPFARALADARLVDTGVRRDGYALASFRTPWGSLRGWAPCPTERVDGDTVACRTPET